MPSSRPPPRSAVTLRGLSAVGALLALAACPSTQATSPSIDEAVAVTPIAPPVFQLLLKGHGFGLRDVKFDLTSGTGEASLYRTRVAVLNQAGVPPNEIRVITATVTSPTEMEVAISLAGPLPAGEYGLELYVADIAEPVATLTPAFAVGAALEPADAGPTPRPDARAPDALPPGEDALPAPDADEAADGGVEAPDATTGFFDASPAQDSGLGEFPPGAGFRRAITLSNDTGQPSPVDLTVRVLVPHAALLAAGQSRADGADLAVYLGNTILPQQIEDRALLGTDRLELIVRLPVSIPPAGSTGLPLALYSDPISPAAAPFTDAVYIFSERFTAALVSDAADPNRYNDRWEQSCPDRLTNAANQAKCRTDAEGGLTRRSLVTPRVLTMTNTPAPNEIYEVVGFIGGAMQTQNDILYFSYGPNNSSFDLTTQLPEGAFDAAFRPTATLTFQETTGRARTVSGWRLPPAGLPYTRMRVSFVPQIATPNLHFRYISADNQTNANTQVRLDDLVVRRALNPEFRVALGPVETR